MFRLSALAQEQFERLIEVPDWFDLVTDDLRLAEAEGLTAFDVSTLLSGHVRLVGFSGRTVFWVAPLDDGTWEIASLHVE
jgi:hypothetical protein